MVVVVRNGAKRQMREIFDYYRTVANRKVAQKIISKISETIDLLTVHSHIGVILPGHADLPFTYRSIVAHPHYKVIYRVEDDKVIVISVWDCRQDPSGLDNELQEE
ncbi:type II toxin-antitoxin system RelE/ParE family toxin [uncultured Mediterranea sp.]|uniref:type II toxin-antitoxin system RelE/ParE family toxin n=1 Tax=uncultured Mediterranea sp. TaxID=1926662 RepID=UPI002805D9A8|nr:type II toxin-antitoxin system RelE/ParE family toxin [uncultured Mediterranea sp.]